MHARLTLIPMAAIALAAGVWLASVAGSDPAMALCNPGRTNDYDTSRHVGSVRSGSNITGVESRVSHYSTYVYYINDDQSSASAWVMIRDTGSSFGWAQLGNIKLPDNDFLVFKEDYSSIGVRRFETFGSPSGNLSYYTVLWDDDIIVYKIDGDTVADESIWWEPDQAEISSETHSYADQMPGAFYTRQHFYESRRREGSTWYDFSGTGYNADPSEYVLNGTSTTHFDTRDSQCTF